MTTFVLAFLEGPELIIILVIILVLFGGSQLPRLARSLGEAKKEFEKGMTPEGKAASETKATEKRSETSSTDEKKTDSDS